MRLKSIWVATMLVAVLSFAMGCDDSGPMENAGEAIDESMDDVGDAMDDAGDEMEDTMDEAKDEMEDATKG
jgi:hypothetical protein